MNVLIIEDDLLWQSRIQMMLEKQKITSLKILSSLSEALKYLGEFSPDLVISDVVFPDGVAYDMFRNLKREYPIVFVTGYPYDDYLQNALSLEKTAFIVKPFHPLTLDGIIQMLFPKQQEEKEVKGIMVPGRFRKKFFLACDSILYIEADSNYVHIYTSERNYIIKRSLRMLMFDLDQRFVQVHKAFVINKDYINRLDLSAQRIIVNGKAIPIGRSFKNEVIALFSQ